MIGRYALACLDMAGTTVRDDGAVERLRRRARLGRDRPRAARGYAEARALVHETMGWSKADVFAALLEPDAAARATAAFAVAYEAIVAAGAVAAIPGAPGRAARAAGRRRAGVPHHRVRSLAPGTPCSTRWAGAPRSTWPCRPADVGRGRPGPDMILGRHGATRRGRSRSRWPWSATR